MGSREWPRRGRKVQILRKYITYGPTNSKAYDTGKIDDALSRNLPSHPDNASKLLAISQEWYAKWEKIGSEMYVDMMTE